MDDHRVRQTRIPPLTIAPDLLHVDVPLTPESPCWPADQLPSPFDSSSPYEPALPGDMFPADYPSFEGFGLSASSQALTNDDTPTITIEHQSPVISNLQLGGFQDFLSHQDWNPTLSPRIEVTPAGAADNFNDLPFVSTLFEGQLGYASEADKLHVDTNFIQHPLTPSSTASLSPSLSSSSRTLSPWLPSNESVVDSALSSPYLSATDCEHMGASLMRRHSHSHGSDDASSSRGPHLHRRSRSASGVRSHPYTHRLPLNEPVDLPSLLPSQPNSIQPRSEWEEMANLNLGSPASPQSPPFRERVASQAIIDASHSRRKKPAAHQCHMCEQAFTSRDNLQSHVDAHLNLKRFKCSQCHQPFRTRSDATRHEKRETCTRNNRSRRPSSSGRPSQEPAI